ncbi:MAG: methyltransferase domain-containing protein [Anaerolinea sp.]|nr:methyltransferase domain-containing protein [Anaerolinea sp.]
MQPQPTKAQFDFVLNAFRGLQTVQVIGLGLRLGMIAALKETGGLTAADLAARLNLHAPYVRVWCEVGYALSVLELDAGRFVLPPGMETVLLDRDHPRYLGGFAEGFISHLAADFDRYPAAFTDGSVHAFGEHGLDFSAWVASLTHPMQRLVVGKVLPETFGAALDRGIDILDVGCGAGQLIFKLADAYPNCRFVGIDVDPYGIELAKTEASVRGYGDRVQFRRTKKDSAPFDDRFDLALMFEVLHELPVSVRPSVLESAQRALKPGGKLFILDETWAENPADLRDPRFTMSVLVQFSELVWGNVVATETEQTRLLTDAGFVNLTRSDLGGVFTLIYAEKPA